MMTATHQQGDRVGEESAEQQRHTRQERPRQPQSDLIGQGAILYTVRKETGTGNKASIASKWDAVSSTALSSSTSTSCSGTASRSIAVDKLREDVVEGKILASHRDRLLWPCPRTTTMQYKGMNALTAV